MHGSTGTSPCFLLYGFHPTSPLDFLANAGREDHPEASDFLEALNMHRESARLAIAKAQERQYASYNKGRKAVPEIKLGTMVLVNPHSLEWLESKGEGAKLVQRWVGPFEVIQKINPKVYRLRMDNKYPGLPIFNFEHLKVYEPLPEDFGERAILSGTRMTKPAKEEFEVEKVVGHRFNKRSKKTEYLVRWAGYSPQFDLWTSRTDMTNAPIALRE